MRKIQTYAAVFFLLLFSWYFASINLFPHLHYVNGNTLAHSHFGGNFDHDHTDDEYRVIDLLSHCESESAPVHSFSYAQFYLSSEHVTACVIDWNGGETRSANALRGPPQA
jgi:hypothetical protein